MSYVRGWHAWYADGTEYSSTTHTPTQLPQIGFLIMMLYFTDGTRRVIDGNDRYFYLNNGSPDGIFAQTDDPAAEVLARYPGCHLIEGQLVPDDQFRIAEEAAHRRKEP